MAKRKNNAGKSDSDPTSANVGYETQLWQIADALRGSMDAAEYKLVAEQASGADPEDPDEYRAQAVPAAAHRSMCP